jgi:hypothetical protein
MMLKIMLQNSFEKLLPYASIKLVPSRRKILKYQVISKKAEARV